MNNSQPASHSHINATMTMAEEDKEGKDDQGCSQSPPQSSQPSSSMVLENILRRTRTRSSTTTTPTSTKTNNDNNANSTNPSTTSSSSQHFFDHVWQKQPMLFRETSESSETQQSSKHSSSSFVSPSIEFSPGTWNEHIMMMSTIMNNGSSNSSDECKASNKATSYCAWDEMIQQRWYILQKLLETSQQRVDRSRSNTDQKNGEIDGPTEVDFLPILFREQSPIPLEDFDHNVYGGYLDDCSIVVNHADLQQEHIAALCLDLQQQPQQKDPSSSTASTAPSSFPHVYANVYITPPGSQTAPPHADDRDVLIFQLIGSKEWNLYENVPIPYPYPHEQVGKDGLVVPPDVLQGPKVIFDERGHSVSATKNDSTSGNPSPTTTTTLCEGDVLYLPRGMVHEARCSTTTTNMPSVHITVAIATHDWTLAGNLGRMIQQRLQRLVTNRMSLLPLPPSADINGEDSTAFIQKMIDGSLQDIRQQCTAQAVLNDITTRIENHNRQAFPLRMKLIHEARMKSTISDDHDGNSNEKTDEEASIMIGLDAVPKISFKSWIRAATPEEREIVNEQQQKRYGQQQQQQQQENEESKSTTVRQPQQRGLQVREDIADIIMATIGYVKSHSTQSFRVGDLRSIIEKEKEQQQHQDSTKDNTTSNSNPMVCDLAILCMVKKAVELGAFVVCR